MFCSEYLSIFFFYNCLLKGYNKTHHSTRTEKINTEERDKNIDTTPKSLWIKAVRRLDAIEIYYSLNDKEYTMMRTCYLEKNREVKVGLMAASPDGEGFTALFEHFSVKHLPDLKRLEWAKKNN